MSHEVELSKLREIMQPGKVDWDGLLMLVRSLQGELNSCHIAYRVQLRVAKESETRIRELTESLTVANQQLATQEFVIAGLRNGIERNLPTIEKVGLFLHEMIRAIPEDQEQERKTG